MKVNILDKNFMAGAISTLELFISLNSINTVHMDDTKSEVEINGALV